MVYRDQRTTTTLAKALEGNRIEFFRRRANLSQQELALLVGIDSTTVSHHEAGSRKPSPQNIAAYARTFKVETWQLFLPEDTVLSTEISQELNARMRIFDLMGEFDKPFPIVYRELKELLEKLPRVLKVVTSEMDYKVED